MSIQGIPEGPRRRAFNAFVRAIQQSPAFKNNRGIKTWRVWNGTGPVAEPTTDNMPAIMVRLLAGPIERIATADDPVGGLPAVDVQAQPTVVIETWVKGSNADDAMDLYDAIDSALFPADPAQRLAIRDAFLDVGITDWQPTRDILPETLSDYGSSSIHSIGAYLLTMNLTQ